MQKVSNGKSFVDYWVKEDSEEKFHWESFDTLHTWMCSRSFRGKILWFSGHLRNLWNFSASKLFTYVVDNICFYCIPTPGCFEMENGNVVWPASHICTTAVHKCEDVDHAFNPGGTVTRYCTNDGTWLDPDYSQCSFKPGTNPFVHLYLTFYTGSSSHILRNLQNIIRTVSSEVSCYILVF